MSARQAVAVATEWEPLLPNIAELKDVDVWAPREETSRVRTPENLVIVGRGVVGCEMAAFYGRLGK